MRTYHGSSSASLPGVFANPPGLRSTGELIAAGKAPYTGELGMGIGTNGISLTGISSVGEWQVNEAVKYAVKAARNPWVPESVKIRMKNLYKMKERVKSDATSSTEEKDFYLRGLDNALKIEWLRARNWGGYTSGEKEMITKPFPVIYAIHEPKLYHGVLLGFDGELLVEGPVQPDALRIYLPGDKVVFAREYSAGKGVAAKIDDFDELFRWLKEYEKANRCDEKFDLVINPVRELAFF